MICNLKSEDFRIIDINYKTAQKSEQVGNYKKAIILYNINIQKYNDPLSKVKLAELYLSGKTTSINNKYARKLLEEAKNQGVNKGNALLACLYSNGIGGKKEKNKAQKLYLEQMKLNNPDSMVYIELSKLLSRKKENKELIKSLKKCVTKTEKRKYKRKIKIQKFNNTLLGKFVNKIPNKINVKFIQKIKKNEKKKLDDSLHVLYEKAHKYKNQGKEATARRIIKRLSNYGYEDANLEYAKMCLDGFGGPQNIYEAKKIYVKFLKSRKKKLSKICKEIQNLEEQIKNIEINKKKISRKNKILKKDITKKIEYLKNEKNEILLNNYYNDAILNYGNLLVDHYSNDIEFKKGICILKSIAKKVEPIQYGNEKLTSKIILRNIKSERAILKLINLYKKGLWIPENLNEEREMFCKFSTTKVSKYTTSISDSMKNKQKIESKNRSNIRKEISKRKLNLYFYTGTLLEFFNINKFARKIYENMYKKGDYRCLYALASMEHYGKGGKSDKTSAKKHYREYLQSTVDEQNEDVLKYRYSAAKDLADLFLEENDIVEAIELYKYSAIKGNKKAKKILIKLNQEQKWYPKSLQEKNLIKVKNKKLTPEETIPKSNIEYTVGDIINISNKNNNINNAKIIGIAAYIDQNNKFFDEKYINNYGMDSRSYIEKLAQTNNINRNALNLLYCVQKNNKFFWINPKLENIKLIQKYQRIYEEEKLCIEK